MRSKRIACVALLLAGSSFLSAGAFAQPSHRGGAPGGHPHYTFAHRDMGHFSPAEHNVWVSGSWNHGWHNGRYGWWWFAGGAWYFYDVPVYPYPGYVSDYYYADEDQGYGPGAYWYWCSAPPGYYPYVRRCGVPWQPVPAMMPPGGGYGPAPGSAYNGPPPGAPPNGQGPGYGPGAPPPGAYGPPPGAAPNDQGQGYGPPPGPNDQGPGDQGPGYYGPGGPPPGPDDEGPGPGDQPPPGDQGGDQPPPPPPHG